MIQLYLIRHGIAEEPGEAWPDDSRRPLTDEGMARLRKVARGLASGLDPRPHIATIDSLAAGASVTAVFADLEKHAKRASVGLVGHEPNIGELMGRLLGSKREFGFKKGAVCRIDVDALPPTARGELRWFLPPKVLRNIR
jgi:phosphohistidine phosphatase